MNCKVRVVECWPTAEAVKVARYCPGFSAPPCTRPENAMRFCPEWPARVRVAVVR